MLLTHAELDPPPREPEATRVRALAALPHQGLTRGSRSGTFAYPDLLQLSLARESERARPFCAYHLNLE